MLFWETLQCNRRFRSFVIDTDKGHEFMILVLFYAMEYKTDASKQGVVRMCIFVLQTLTTEPTLGKRLNRKFEGQESLPSSIRLDGFDGTYADFLIVVWAFLLLRFRRSLLIHIRPSTYSLHKVKESLMRFIQPFWLLSTT